MLKKIFKRIFEDQPLDFEAAILLATKAEPQKLFETANELRRRIQGKRIDLCSIANARSGKCSEDCKFCAQSSHYHVDIEKYEILPAETALAMAKENADHGVERFSLVTAGKNVSDENLLEFQKIYQILQKETNLSLCASMGFLTLDRAIKLKEMGVTRYHCNLETAKSFFPSICTTHSWDDKIATIQLAQKVGMEICSGGIIGLGESVEQRIELALSLRDLGVLSIPINILTPIKGTPLEDLAPLSNSEILVCIAMFRIINPRAIIRLAGGRTILGKDQYKCFLAGANGAIVGNYLTTVGNNLDEDIAMFRALGFKLSKSP